MGGTAPVRVLVEDGILDFLVDFGFDLPDEPGFNSRLDSDLELPQVRIATVAPGRSAYRLF